MRKKNWRQGIGRALMEILIKTAKELGAEKIALDMNADNIAALNLYKSLGFVQEGVLKDQVKYPSGQYGDIILMGLFTHTDNA